MTNAAIHRLAAQLEGELVTDSLSRTIYATDASEYQERPLAVAWPESATDVQQLIRFAAAEGVGIIPRAAGTSLAGQVVGGGIVVDAGRHLNRIIALDVKQRRVRVQPGVIRNDLNRFLAPHGLFFGPETSTANWAMLGGMVGNNSCGSNSIAYGSTRDHLISVRGFLSDGSEASFGPLSAEAFVAKCNGPDCLETRIYQRLAALLGDASTRQTIREAMPKPEVTRRNTGYALDALLDASCFDPASDKPFNLCRLLAGSEGTLFFGVEYELNLLPLPPAGGLLVVHCESVTEALQAAVLVMQRRHCLPAGQMEVTAADPPQLTGCELIDSKILDCTKENLEQARNRTFVVGEPGAVLVVELRHPEQAQLEAGLAAIAADLKVAGIGYAFPKLFGSEADKVWELRRAGQGLVNNLPGAAKPREVIEDTAVAIDDLPAYISEVDHLLATNYGIDCVHYAHAGAGELHLRPLFDLHTATGLAMFRGVAADVAALVKKYRGSLSGEHGDGRLRGEFIRMMVGDACYELFRQVKQIFDPAGIFNPGKIIDTPPMDSQLRITPGQTEPEHETVFRFADTGGVLRAAEKCTGVGQCRKPAAAGGTMCPSYMATRNESDTTRARANVLRQALSDPSVADPWSQPEIAEAMDLCLSCKACKSECPSSVDMARLKAEWEQHRHDACGVPLRTRLLARSAGMLRLAADLAPWAYNVASMTPALSRVVKWLLGVAPGRSLPPVSTTTLRRWHRRLKKTVPQPAATHGRVHLFVDEFTDTLDVSVGIAAIELLEALGYEVVLPAHVDSGRGQISKGLLREAQPLATRNVELLATCVTAEEPLIGLEPSAILGFRDEYPDLVPAALLPQARSLAANTLLIDEFLAREIDRGRVTSAAFTTTARKILLHGHCHQKALASVEPTRRLLTLPANYTVEIIPSGCCGMAGSFGYEREHFDVSMQIGELVLFPAVRAAVAETLLAAPGTSCRHQIKDGTGRIAQHPVEILRAALRPT
ncbi:MAG: FAD-binding oxidoreductase [Planctomycetia bacterium]|nr:FAD-binding oxidoreductase [Planctomycetia bacterium]